MSAYSITRSIGQSWSILVLIVYAGNPSPLLYIYYYYKKIAGAIKTIHDSANFEFSAVLSSP